LAAEFKRKFSVEPVLIAGAGGVFDVEVDGKLVYSKDQTGRFPNPDEVTDPLIG